MLAMRQPLRNPHSLSTLKKTSMQFDVPSRQAGEEHAHGLQPVQPTPASGPRERSLRSPEGPEGLLGGLLWKCQSLRMNVWRRLGGGALRPEHGLEL